MNLIDLIHSHAKKGNHPAERFIPSYQEQAYRYSKGTWAVSEARKHCKDHGDSFEAATSEFDTNPLILGGD